MNHQSMMPPMSSSSQMMAPQSHLHNSIASSGLDANIQPIFELYGHDPLAAVQNSQLHHQQPRFDMSANSGNQQGFAQLQQQTTWIPPEASSEVSKAKWAKPEAGAEAAAENDTKEDAAKPDAASGSPTKKGKGRRKKEEGSKKKQKQQEILADAKKGFQRKNIR